MVCGRAKKKEAKAKAQAEAEQKIRDAERKAEERKRNLEEQNEMERQALLRLEEEEQRRVEEERLRREREAEEQKREEERQKDLEKQREEEEERQRQEDLEKRRQEELEEERRQEELEEQRPEELEEERRRQQRGVEAEFIARNDSGSKLFLVDHDSSDDDNFVVTQPVETQGGKEGLISEPNQKSVKDKDRSNKAREDYNREERMAVLKMMEEEENARLTRNEDRYTGLGLGQSEEAPLLANPPMRWEEATKPKAAKKKRDNKKFLPCLLCLLCLLLLLLLLLCGWLAWGMGETAGEEAARTAAAEAKAAEIAARASARYGNAHAYAGSHYAQNGGAGGDGNAAGSYGGAGGKAAGNYGGAGGNAVGNYEGAGENAAGNYEGAGENASGSHRGGSGGTGAIGVAAGAGGHGSAAAAAKSSPPFAAGPFADVKHGSVLSAENSGPGDGIYHEVKNTYGMTAWKRGDGKCEVRRLVVDRWDLICDGEIQCSRPLTDELEPPIDRFYCENIAAAPVFRSARGNVLVSGSPKEWRVPGKYFEQSELKNGKPWYKSERNCIIYWSHASTSWELWCFSDRWCKTVIPLYMFPDNTATPTETEWRMQTGRAHGIGPPPTISFEHSGKSLESAIQDEVELLGDLDAQKKMAHDAGCYDSTSQALSLLPAAKSQATVVSEAYMLRTIHI